MQTKLILYAINHLTNIFALVFMSSFKEKADAENIASACV